MNRAKIDYGIDLGTTNSAIARMENGNARIIRTDIGAEIMPSCVFFDKKTIRIGQQAWNKLKSDRLRAWGSRQQLDYNAFIEFKRTMGTDKLYFSSNMQKSFTSEELSAEVLKMLKSFVNDEEIKSIIITVPAKFTANQKDATAKAASLAGFVHYELLQEPIAASFAYGMESNKVNGYWIVFDFGGGTFDAALLKVDDGIMKVIDTEGNNHLGGKDLDYTIIDKLLLPHLLKTYNLNSNDSDQSKKNILRETLKYFAETTRIQLSYKDKYNLLTDIDELGKDDSGEDIIIDLTITKEELEKCIASIYQRAVDLTKELINRNNITRNELAKVILVGGPTYSPIIRTMLKNEICDVIDTSVDPMTAVAKGAAIYASTINMPEKIRESNRDVSKIQLDLGYEASTVELSEFITIKISQEKNKICLDDSYYAEIVSHDGAWSSGRHKIETSGDIVEVTLKENTPNTFRIIIYDKKGNSIPIEPDIFTIIQGAKVGDAILPRHIGVNVYHSSLEKDGFYPIKGLEKNKPLPAKGVVNGLKTQRKLRPGNKDDNFKISLYEGEYNAEGTRAKLNEHVYDYIITGDDVPKLLPENSDIDLTISIDRSGQLSIKVYIPLLDHTFEAKVPRDQRQKEISTQWLANEINDSKNQTVELIGKNEQKDELQKLLSQFNELDEQLKQAPNDSDRKKQVLDELRKDIIRLDRIKEESEWPQFEKKLKEKYYLVDELYKEHEGEYKGLNEERVKNLLNNFKSQIPQIIKEKNVKVAKEVYEQLDDLHFALVDSGMGVYFEISIIKDIHANFHKYNWHDASKAQMLLNQAMRIMNDNPTKDQLRPIVVELYNLLPEKEKAKYDESLLRK